MSSDVISVERVIPVPADQVFALISDPRRHQEFDGSGTVREAKNVPDRLELGARFGMDMKLGLPYSMVSTVIEYEQDRRLAWQTTSPLPIVGRFVGGRIWRYELEPVEGGTLVRESWNITQEKRKSAVRPLGPTTRKNMERTLERIEQVLTPSPQQV
ncbi:MAG: SRPBCC family protein [Mycobacteriales bacterium]